MGWWTDIARHYPVDTENQGGAMRSHLGVVEHHAEGTYLGTIAWQLNPVADVSSHFVVSYGGDITQMVDTDRQSWCQANGNPDYLSIEFEGWHTEALTPAQVAAAGRIMARANAEYGIPLKLANSPGERGLAYHGMGGAAWGNHPDCPGPQAIAQRADILAQASGGAAPVPAPARKKGKRMHVIIQPLDGSGIGLAWPSEAAKGWVFTNIVPPGAAINSDDDAPRIVQGYLDGGAIDGRGWEVASWEGYTNLADVPGAAVELGDVTVGLGPMAVSLTASGSISGGITPRS